MIPLIQNVVLVLYPQEKRGFIMGIIGLVIAFGPALGPTVGGWIIDNLGLKWLFGILVPLIIILLAISLFNAKNVHKIDRTQRVDWLNLVLALGRYYMASLISVIWEQLILQMALSQ